MISLRLHPDTVKAIQKLTGKDDSNSGAVKKFILDNLQEKAIVLQENQKNQEQQISELIQKIISEVKDENSSSNPLSKQAKALHDIVAYGAYAQKNMWETIARVSYGNPTTFELLKILVITALMESEIQQEDVMTTMRHPLPNGAQYLLNGLRYGASGMGLNPATIPKSPRVDLKDIMDTANPEPKNEM